MRFQLFKAPLNFARVFCLFESKNTQKAKDELSGRNKNRKKKKIRKTLKLHFRYICSQMFFSCIVHNTISLDFLIYFSFM